MQHAFRHLCAPFLFLFALCFGALAPAHAQDWSAVDKHALAAPAAIESNPQKLGQYLGAPYTDPRSKLRSVYRWVTDRMKYDTDSYRSGRQNHQSAQQALNARVSTCDGFSTLFSELAQHAGVTVLPVLGYVKDALHQKGEHFNDTNHAWNLVQLDGQWWVIDSTWGAGYDDGVKFNQRFEPYYFLVHPDELKLTHWARDNVHRVGETARDMAEFRRLPYVPTTLLNIGKLSPKDIELASAHGFVNTFDLPSGSLNVRKAPLNRQLKVDSEVTWELESNWFDNFAVLHNGAWTFFEPVGGRIFRASLTPQSASSVQIAAKRAQDANYTIVLDYAAK